MCKTKTHFLEGCFSDLFLLFLFDKTKCLQVATQSQTQDVAWRIMTARTLQDFFVTSWTAFANQVIS